MDYAEAGAAARAVLYAANRAELTVRQHRVLGAVIALTALYSRLEDRVYLGQIAAFAHGVEHAAPWMLKKTRETLSELEERGLILKAPPRGRPPLGHEGPAYWIALGTPESDPAPGVRFSGESDPAPGPKVTPPPDRKAPRPRTESDPGAGGESDPAPGPPTEKTSEEAPEEPAEEGRRGARARRVNGNHVGSLAARLTACATTAAPELEQEAERVSELVLDHLPADVADRALDDLLESGEIPQHPGAVLTALEPVVDDDHADTIEDLYADRRFRALVRGGTVLAIADACPGPWAEHLEEAELVVEYAARHGIPDDLLRGALEEAALDGLKRPGHVARRLRTTAAEVGLELPPLELPPARRIRRSK